MIIINQDQTCVICGEVADLYIAGTNAQTEIKADMQSDPNNSYILAAYSTARQAREVLLDMAECICNPDERIYQMPPDQKPEPIPAKWTSQLSAHWDGLRESAT